MIARTVVALAAAGAVLAVLVWAFAYLGDRPLDPWEGMHGR